MNKTEQSLREQVVENRLTQKQENFVNDIFACMTQHDAYVKNYSTKNMLANTIDRAAHQLTQNSKIATRLEALRQEVKSDLIADAQERQRILSEIARGKVTDYTTCGADGDLVIVDKNSPNLASLQEVVSKTEYDKDGSGTAVVTRIKMHDPIRAVDILNKMDRVYSESAQVSNQTINILVMSEEAKELTKRILAGVRTEDAEDEMGSA